MLRAIFQELLAQLPYSLLCCGVALLHNRLTRKWNEILQWEAVQYWHVYYTK